MRRNRTTVADSSKFPQYLRFVVLAGRRAGARSNARNQHGSPSLPDRFAHMLAR
ncbi:MAG: hypothetical protein H0T78_00785 [Longispora sp.]|nr:hypothetical protein [Longispora sp. (in: high G+C Gram-positive bacteria)]